jgi:phosphate acyltransferase
MICHGGSNERAIMNAIRLAQEFVTSQVNEQLIAQLRRNGGELPATSPEESLCGGGTPA